MNPKIKTVIVVDDEVNIVELLVEILESADYRAIGCPVWTDAMNAIGRDQPDLVLLDMKMPTIDGPSMLEFIRKEGLDVPVIVVSGFVTDQVSEDLSKLGVSAFINKPFRAAEILEQVAAPDAQGRALLVEAAERMHLSARGYHRVLRVARTLADLEEAGTTAYRGGIVIPPRHAGQITVHSRPAVICARRQGAVFQHGAQGAAGENMEMQVHDFLMGIAAFVSQHPIAAFAEPQLTGRIADGAHQPGLFLGAGIR